MKPRMWLIAAGLLAACERDLPTTTNRPAESNSRWISAEQAEQAQIAIDDVLSRVVPVLTSEGVAAPLASSLATLRGTLREGPVDEAALARALAQVERYDQDTGADGEELDVIRLALAVVQD